MDNTQDKTHVLTHIKQLKEYNDKLSECLSAINLISVDNNNSRVKDETLKSELQNLSNQINSISSSINTIEKSLN